MTLAPAPAPAERERRLAWTALATIPVFFVLAFAVGEGLYAALGYDPGTGGEPLWVELLVAAVALPVFLAPCVAAVVLGRRARRGGDRGGLVPALIGGLVGAGFVVLNTVTVLADQLR
jgi:hypothetical protein